MRIIKDQKIIDDQWQHIVDTDIASLPEGKIVVPLALWQENKSELAKRNGELGVKLSPDTDLEEIAQDLGHFSIIILPFESFRDGRAYSLALRLRQHHGYQNEIRATGNVLRDQIGYMARVGFNAFEVDPKQDIDDALKAFDEINIKYQASSDEPTPLYRRRA